MGLGEEPPWRDGGDKTKEKAAPGPPAEDQRRHRDGRLPPLMSLVAAERAAAVRESTSRASASARNKYHNKASGRGSSCSAFQDNFSEGLPLQPSQIPAGAKSHFLFPKSIRWFLYAGAAAITGERGGNCQAI